MGAFTLELLHFDRGANPPARRRVFNEPGLTHLSLTVDDLPATLAKVRELGGEVVEATDIGVAVLVRDPDGQLVELLRTRG
jgi:predicted enzyme related to lactoylglutathione lyase